MHVRKWMLGLTLLALVSTTAGQSGREAETARALDGTIDIHVHSFPDNRARAVDALEAAEGGGLELELFTLISHVDADQRAEIARMQRMLNTLQ